MHDADHETSQSPCCTIPVHFPMLDVFNQLVTVERLPNGNFRLLSNPVGRPNLTLVGGTRTPWQMPQSGDEIELRVRDGELPECVRVVNGIPYRWRKMLIFPSLSGTPDVQAVLARFTAEGGTYTLTGDELLTSIPRASGLDLWEALRPTGVLKPYQRGMDVPPIHQDASEEDVIAACKIASEVLWREFQVAVSGMAANIGSVFQNASSSLHECVLLMEQRQRRRRARKSTRLTTAELDVVDNAITWLEKLSGRMPGWLELFSPYAAALDRFRTGTLHPGHGADAGTTLPTWVVNRPGIPGGSSR